MSLSAARMLITPRPSRSLLRKSLRLSAGSPRNLSAPWFSSIRSWRCTEAIEALATLPYLALISAALSETKFRSAQILEVEHRQMVVVGDPEGDVEDPPLHVVELEETRQQQRP